MPAMVDLPSPSVVTPNACHLSQCVCKQAAESPCQNRTTKEQVEAPLQLVSLVVHAYQIETSREEACLEQADQETKSDKALERVHESL